MICLHIKELAQAKGINNAYQLRTALSVSPTVATRLWSNDVELISRTNLNKLCALLDCTPGDLITYVAELEEQRTKRRRA